MSRMNTPWANSEQFGDALPEFLRSPMTLAMGASVLAHGVFFLGLPAVMNPNDPQDIRPVNVVQLTPQDQAQTPVIDQQPSIPLSPNGLLNGSPNGLRIPPIPASPIPSPQPSDSSVSSSGSTSQPSYSLPSYSLPSDNSNNAYYEEQIRVAKEREAEARSALEKERLKQTLKPSPPPSPSGSPSPSALPSVAPSVIPSGASPSPSPSPLTNAPAPQTPPTPAPGQRPTIIASVNPFNTTMAQKIPNGLVYNAESTEPVSLQGTSNQWYSANVLSNPRLQKQENTEVMASAFAKQVGSLIVPSSRKTEEIKSYDPKQQILIGFVAAPNGQILDKTIGIARSSGYPELNAIAVGEVRDHLRKMGYSPTASKKYEIRTIGVTFTVNP